MEEGFLVLQLINNTERNFVERMMTLKRLKNLLEEKLGEDLKNIIMEIYYKYLERTVLEW